MQDLQFKFVSVSLCCMCISCLQWGLLVITMFLFFYWLTYRSLLYYQFHDGACFDSPLLHPLDLFFHKDQCIILKCYTGCMISNKKIHLLSIYSLKEAHWWSGKAELPALQFVFGWRKWLHLQFIVLPFSKSSLRLIRNITLRRFKKPLSASCVVVMPHARTNRSQLLSGNWHISDLSIAMTV